MYAGVPTATPVTVSRASPSAARAIPKSDTSTWPVAPSTRMLSGFTSRCTTWRACAYASASATSRSIARTIATGGRGSRASRCASVSPSTSPIEKNTTPSISSTVKIGTMFGCDELRGHLRLAQESRFHLGAEREFGRQNLERDLSAQANVARAIHDRHAAAADLILDFKERADRAFHAVAQRVTLGHDRPDSVRGVFVLGLIRAISSATYTALSTSRASAIAWSATDVMCCQLSAFVPVRKPHDIEPHVLQRERAALELAVHLRTGGARYPRRCAAGA